MPAAYFAIVFLAVAVVLVLGALLAVAEDEGDAVSESYKAWKGR